MTLSLLLQALKSMPDCIRDGSYVVMFSILGVITRIYLQDLFSQSNITSGSTALFTALPPNVIGSFLLGLISNASVVGHGRTKKATDQSDSEDALPQVDHAWGILPQHHLFNSHEVFIDLNFGLRIGYLSSVTTFASWNLQMVQMLCKAKGYLWLESIVGYLLGLYFAICSFVVGKIIARIVNDIIERKRNNAYESCTDEQAQSEIELQDKQQTDPAVECEKVDIPTKQSNIGKAFSGKCLNKVKQLAKIKYYQEVRVVAFGATILGSIVLFILFALLYGFNIGSSVWSSREIWLSAILGPVGAIVRWQLARLNQGTVIKAKYWSAFPLGTFLANIIASTIDTVLAGVLQDKKGSFGIDTVYAINAIITGTSGAMSTASTFVGEIDGLAGKRGLESMAFVYALTSLSLACVIGVATFGWSVWV